MEHKKLTVENPALALEWDYEKNGKLQPRNFLSMSNKHIWWKCSLGHSWKAPISRRNAGSSCPYCNNNKVLAGFNDIAAIHPQLVTEWDYIKNNGLRPEDFVAGSNKKAWWICDLGHSWRSVISSRTAQGCGCPYCANLKALKGFNDLLSAEPELCLQWDYEKNAPLRPDEITAESNKKVWWVCDNGHSWETSIHVRRIGCECPYCIGRRAIPGETDLKTLKPDVAAEWNYEKNGDLRPENFTVYSNKYVWWKCSLGHNWRTAISHRSTGKDCPYCKGRKVWKGFNDLSTTHPRLASEWDYNKNKGLYPEQFSAGSNKRFWWRCKRGHCWNMGISTRIRTSCPYCSNKRVLKGYNDLLSVDSELSSQWDYEKNAPLKPDEVVANFEKKVWWKCAQGHSWKTVIGLRRRGADCPYCVGKLVIPGETDLKTVRPEIAAEWDYKRNGAITPDKVLPYCNTKFWWVCEHGHSYSASVGNRSLGKGCPYCVSKRPIIGENDLLTINPKWIEEWDYEKNGRKKPEHYTACSNARIWWKCKNEHSWRTQIRDRNLGNQCPYCNGRTPMRTRLVM